MTNRSQKRLTGDKPYNSNEPSGIRHRKAHSLILGSMVNKKLQVGMGNRGTFQFIVHELFVLEQLLNPIILVKVFL